MDPSFHGQNTFGQLGDGTKQPSPNPIFAHLLFENEPIADNHMHAKQNTQSFISLETVIFNQSSSIEYLSLEVGSTVIFDVSANLSTGNQCNASFN